MITHGILSGDLGTEHRSIAFIVIVTEPGDDGDFGKGFPVGLEKPILHLISFDTVLTVITHGIHFLADVTGTANDG